MKQKPKIETCANCSTDFNVNDHGTRFATTLFREAISVIGNSVLNKTEEFKEKDHVILKKRSRVVLCPACSDYFESAISSGTLVKQDTQDIEFNQDEIQTKKLSDFLIAHDAFFPCLQIRSYIGKVKGRHPKFTWDLEWKERKKLNNKRHFDLKETEEGEILKIRGFRGEIEITRFILVTAITKYWMSYYILDEERVLMVFPRSEPIQDDEPSSYQMDLTAKPFREDDKFILVRKEDMKDE